MNNQVIIKEFGDNVRKQRIKRGLSQEQLGFIARMDRTYIGMIERGEKNITLKNIKKIASALNVSIVTLITLENVEEKRELSPGDHGCCFFESQINHRKIMSQYITTGLQKNQRVLYIFDKKRSLNILNDLDKAINVDQCVSKKQLIFTNYKDVYFKDGPFNPDRMISLLNDETRNARNSGFTALRITGETTWALRSSSETNRLVEYENKLNDFFPHSNCLGLCQYDRKFFSPQLLLSILAAHPVVCIGDNVLNNPIYISSGTFTGAPARKNHFDLGMKILLERNNIDQDKRKIDSSRQIGEYLRTLLAEKEIYIKEFHHRTRNNFQLLQSKLNIIKRKYSSKQAKDLAEEFSGVLHIISDIYAFMSENKEYNRINIKRLGPRMISDLLAGLQLSTNIRSVVKMDNIVLSTKQTTICFLIIHELIINCIKYAFAHRNEGKIIVSIKLNKNNCVKLSVWDNGVGMDKKFNLLKSYDKGLGLVKSLAETQLAGKMKILTDDSGTRCTVTFQYK